VGSQIKVGAAPWWIWFFRLGAVPNRPLTCPNLQEKAKTKRNWRGATSALNLIKKPTLSCRDSQKQKHRTPSISISTRKLTYRTSSISISLVFFQKFCNHFFILVSLLSKHQAACSFRSMRHFCRKTKILWKTSLELLKKTLIPILFLTIHKPHKTIVNKKSLVDSHYSPKGSSYQTHPV
jgi:hypothetical protein